MYSLIGFFRKLFACVVKCQFFTSKNPLIIWRASHVRFSRRKFDILCLFSLSASISQNFQGENHKPVWVVISINKKKRQRKRKIVLSTSTTERRSNRDVKFAPAGKLLRFCRMFPIKKKKGLLYVRPHVSTYFQAWISSNSRRSPRCWGWTRAAASSTTAPPPS